MWQIVHRPTRCPGCCLNRYVRLLGAMYMRLTGTAVDCYKYLEPLYNDYRKVKTQNRNGGESEEVNECAGMKGQRTQIYIQI